MRSGRGLTQIHSPNSEFKPGIRQAYVIGFPIAHSLSPAIHNAAFAATGFDGHYRAVEVAPDQLEAWVKQARGLETLGFNVTLPHKEAIIRHLDRIEGDAELAGAVNTVIAMRPDSARPGLSGTNTDGIGFRQMLAEEAHTTLTGKKVLLLGAGGAARAVALVALQDGAHTLWVANRHEERARGLLTQLSTITTATAAESLSLADPRLQALMGDADIIVNATSVGLRQDELPADPGSANSSALVIDLIYNPAETAFMHAARGRGIQVLGGLGMLVHQAAAAFERWTAIGAPIPVMRAAADTALRDRAGR
ncbi:MAG: shikimate dehydrogenase [Chloroflexi bacterium]|nr:shikimate dehydrogenase [Chloroflexota bacterium]